MKIDNITTHEQYAESLMIQGNTGYHRVFLVAEFNLPVRTDPGELFVYPDAKPAVFALDMVLLADVRKIKVTDVVMMIEADEEFAVSNRDVSWHVCILQKNDHRRNLVQCQLKDSVRPLIRRHISFMSI
jgi:hypothetical protein